MFLPPLHALNTRFSWQDRRADNLKRLSVADINHFNEHGYMLIRNAVNAEQLSALVPIIDSLEAHEKQTVLTVEDGNSVAFTTGADQMTFACNLTNRDTHVQAFASNTLMREIMHDLIGPDVRLYWDQAVYKKPQHATDFAWHQDNGYTFIEPQDYITCWLALSDADASNGCPWVLPGLHRYGTFSHDHSKAGLVISGLDHENIADRAVCTPAKAGDMVVFSSLTPHMTGPNLTDTTRKAFILQYCAENAASIDANGQRKPLNKDNTRFPILKNGLPV